MVTDFDLNVARRRRRPGDQAAGRGGRADGRLRPVDAREVRPARRSSTAGSRLEEAEQQVLAYVREHCTEGSRPPLAGNTVGTDRAFISRDMKDLDAFLHYRIVDVSSIKELSRRWYPRAYFAAPAKRGNHRALADILESIEELRYYRAADLRARRPAPTAPRRRPWPQEHGGSLTGSRRRPPRWEFRGPDCPTLSARPRVIPGPHGGCSSAGRAPRCGRGCRGFKSRHSPHGGASVPRRADSRRAGVGVVDAVALTRGLSGIRYRGSSRACAGRGALSPRPP